tara:strand:- start:19623 stop:19889 length:267 start_codon:yes stop_codon:yes gene_type:complete
MSVIGKAAKHLMKKKSRSYTKKKASKKTRVARNKAKKHKDWEHDLASEEFAYKNPGQRIPSKKALIGKKPPSKRVDPKRKKKHEIDLP